MTGRALLLVAGALLSAAAGLLALRAGPPDDRARETVARPLDGAAIFHTRACASCHRGPESEPAVPVGPDLSDAAAWAGQRRAGLTAEAYLAESIRDPGAFVSPVAPTGAGMPDLGLSDREIEALVDYLLGRPGG